MVVPTYPVCVLVEVAHPLPSCYEEPPHSESSTLLGKQARYFIAGPVEQSLICAYSVVDTAAIIWSSVYISPVG